MLEIFAATFILLSAGIYSIVVYSIWSDWQELKKAREYARQLNRSLRTYDAHKSLVVKREDVGVYDVFGLEPKD